jgi:hypothetical protein
MSFASMFSGRLKALLRDGASLTVLLLCVAVALMAGWYGEKKQEGRLTLALVNEDRGELSLRLVNMLEQEEALKLLSVDDAAARRLLMQDRVQCAARIPADFSERLQQRQFRELVELNVSSGSAYAATVSEPLVNAVMKLWFEQQIFYDTEELLDEQGLEFSPEQRQELQSEMERVWIEGAAIRVESIMPTGEAPPAPLRADPALGWYAALIPFYLIVSCGWMLQDGYHGLRRRIRQSGYPDALLFLSQSGAALVPAAAGFVLTALLAGSTPSLPRFLPHMLAYCLGCIGPALILCTLCRSFSGLLLTAPTLTMAAAAICGLLLPLPDWAEVWVIISKALPGRFLYGALTGQADLARATLLAAFWLGAGLLCVRVSGREAKHHFSRGVDVR